MKKNFLIVLSVFIICLNYYTVCLGKENTSDQEIGRYQIYSSSGQQSVMVLLDTKTGKLWQLSTDNMSGKTQFEGVTVEGVVYASKDAELLNKKIAEIDINNVSDKYRKACKDKLSSAFSYQLNNDTINSILKEFPIQTEEK